MENNQNSQNQNTEHQAQQTQSQQESEKQKQQAIERRKLQLLMEALYRTKPKVKPMNAEMVRKGIMVTYLMMKGGLRRFSDYCEAMVDELGDGIRPHLKSLYAWTQNLEEVIEAGWDEEMDDRKTVKAFDVYNFDKAGAIDFKGTEESKDET